MKHLLLLTILFSITTASFSQINKGQWLIGGNASFSTDKENGGIVKDRSTAFQLSPNAGYFVSDKLAVGARINFLRDKNEIEYGSYTETSNSSISLSPFVRYYFLPKSEKLNLFADAGYLYGRTKNKYEGIYAVQPSNSLTSKGTTRGYHISAGPVIFLNPSTAVELTLSYNYQKQKDYDYTNKGFMAGIGFQIHF